MKVWLVGAGPGDPELLTVKASRLIAAADVLIYAGSLVNPEALKLAPAGAALHDSSRLHSEEIQRIIADAGHGGAHHVVRLHSGDPAFYGAIEEEIQWLEEQGIDWEIVPGVTAASAAAAAIGRELTSAGRSQTVIICRTGGRTPVPDSERLSELARHGATLCIYLSAGLADEVASSLSERYPADTPVVIVARASWPDQKLIRSDLSGFAARMRQDGVTRQAVILVGPALTGTGTSSRLYDKEFEHGFR